VINRRNACSVARTSRCTHLSAQLEATLTGQIRTLRVDKGFGFIKDEAGQEYFFHQSAIQGERIDDLREGDSVEFDVGQGPKGPRAENVRRTST
jgi:CspA family cold shock protein